ncbi:MAG: hypothetical protein LRS46_02510 [Desulfurococcales archaeon]|nr:hypothetical protein [Desulfurococcales archaeon]
MGVKARRKALSPLVSTIVLISAAIVGGVIVYNYFQNSVHTIAASSGTLEVSANSYYLNATSKLVYIDVFNSYSKEVTIKSVKAVLVNGTIKEVSVTSKTIAPGAKASIVVTLPANTKAVYVEYVYNNQNLESNPVTI